MTTKTTHVAIRVAIVIPEIGLEEVPMMPTIREETVTKKNPKMTIRSDMRREPGNGPCGKPGRIASTSTIASDPITTIPMPRSLSVRLTPSAGPTPPRKLLTDSRNAEMIVGRVLMSVITPAQATAPAPM